MLSFSFSWLQFPRGCHFLGHSIWPAGMREAIRRPTVKVVRSVLDQHVKSWKIWFWKLSYQNLFKNSGPWGFWTPLFFSPRDPRIPQVRPPNYQRRRPRAIFFRFFWLLKCLRIFSSKILRKKCPNRRFWVRKSSQNRTFFDSFLKASIFQKLCSRLDESSIFKVRSLPKTTQNRCRNRVWK